MSSIHRIPETGSPEPLCLIPCADDLPATLDGSPGNHSYSDQMPVYHLILMSAANDGSRVTTMKQVLWMRLM